MEIDTLCKEFLQLKTELKVAEIKYNAKRQKLLSILEEKNLDQFSTSDYTILKKIIQQKRITKESCPSDIFEKYAKPCNIQYLEVLPEKKMEERRQRISRSRSPKRILNKK